MTLVTSREISIKECESLATDIIKDFSFFVTPFYLLPEFGLPFYSQLLLDRARIFVKHSAAADSALAIVYLRAAYNLLVKERACVGLGARRVGRNNFPYKYRCT